MDTQDRQRRLIELLHQALTDYGQHDIGCPGWFRAVRTDSDPSPPVKCITDPCDCGLDEALAAPDKADM